MKKAIKYLAMAALATVIGACSNDDNELTQQPAKAKGIPFTATISLEKIATTRALTEDTENKKILATWATGEKVALIYNVGTTPYKTDATVTKQTDGTATINATLQEGATNGSDVTIIYPATAADGTTGNVKANLLASQDGTLASIATNYDVRKGTAKLSIGAGGATVNNGTAGTTVALTNQNAIFKFTLSGTSIDNSHPLVIKDGSEKDITTVKPASSTNSVYVAMPAAASSTYKFIVTTDNNKYIKSGTAAITAGYYYQTTLEMTPRYPLGISQATIDDIGSVVSSEGTMYLNTTVASAAGKPAVAVIAYVGSDTGENSPYNHGLAMALNNAGYCMWSESDTDANTTDQREPFSPEGGRQYIAGRNSDAYPAFKAAITYKANDSDISSWFLPSAYQWTQMINGAGSIDHLRKIANLINSNYWTSSEYKYDMAWNVDTNDGVFYYDNKSDEYFVRACFAF